MMIANTNQLMTMCGRYILYHTHLHIGLYGEPSLVCVAMVRGLYYRKPDYRDRHDYDCERKDIYWGELLSWRNLDFLSFQSNNTGIVKTSVVSPANKCSVSRLTRCICDNLDGAIVDECRMLKHQRWLFVTLCCRWVSHENVVNAKSILLKIYSRV